MTVILGSLGQKMSTNRRNDQPMQQMMMQTVKRQQFNHGQNNPDQYLNTKISKVSSYADASESWKHLTKIYKASLTTPTTMSII